MVLFSFSMSELVQSKEPRTGDSSLAALASPTTKKNKNALEIPDGPFCAHFHKFKSVYANWRIKKQLSQPIGYLRHDWLGIALTKFLKNATESECDHDEGWPQVVDGVSSTESDDEALWILSSFAHHSLYVLLAIIVVVADHNSSEVWIVSHRLWAVTDERTATR